MIRAGFLAAITTLAMLSSACENLVKVSDKTIPRLITPLSDASFQDLTNKLHPFTDLKSLRASQVYILFTDAETSERYRFEADSIILLERPDKIRLIIQAPAIKSKLADMVSIDNRFKVGIFPSEYQRFLIGSNNKDYSEWRAKLGEKGRSALISARPFHFTETLLMKPLNLNDPKYVYSMEEALIEEPDLNRTSKKGARIIRSFYVISEVEVSSDSKAASRVKRRFWFDRTDKLRFARQQIFDNNGQLVTELTYSNYQPLNPADSQIWPGVILVNRPHDGYSARLTFTDGKFEINPNLPPSAFSLENTDNLPLTDLDKPITP